MESGWLFKVLVVVGLWCFTFGARASCIETMQELNAMNVAQQQLLQSFVNKNETVAMSLDSFAARFAKKQQKAKALTAAEVASLSTSADSFRAHQNREQQLVDRFNKVSSELMAKVQSCLNQRVSDAK